MSFAFVDSILEIEPRRLLAAKTVSAMDWYLPGAYKPGGAIPASLLIECMAQTGGWLNIIARDFHVKTLIGLVVGVKMYRPVLVGETVTLEARMQYAHADGATMTTRAWVNEKPAASIEQMLFLHLWDDDEEFATGQRQRLATLTAPHTKLQAVSG